MEPHFGLGLQNSQEWEDASDRGKTPTDKLMQRLVLVELLLNVVPFYLIIRVGILLRSLLALFY